MEKTYYFKLNLNLEGKTPLLNIKPTAYIKKPIPYPINFSELNVPIIINKSSLTDSFDLEYFLDFENSFNEKGEDYNVFNRGNLRRVLCDLGIIIDKDLRKALCLESKLKKKFKVISNNGLEGYYNPTRLGNPKKAKNSNFPLIRKTLTV